MKKKWWHFAVAFVLGGFFFAPVLNGIKQLVGR